MLLSLFTRVSIYSSKFSKIVPKSRQEMVNLESLVQIIIFLNNFNVICWLEFGGEHICTHVLIGIHAKILENVSVPIYIYLNYNHIGQMD